jgi:type II secretory pathway component PulK
VKARRGGFVLVAALWLIVALGAVGLDAAVRSQARRLAAANIVDGTRAREAALAGAEYARSRLSAAMLERADELRAESEAARRAAAQRGGRQAAAPNIRTLFRNADPLEDPWRDPQGLVIESMMFGSARFTLRLRDAGAALNVNAADEAMLRQFLAEGLGLDYDRADRLTQAILDWRDEDELPRINGAEREEYLRAGRAVLPPNRNLADLDELLDVIGMDAELFERMRPYLSVVGSGQINVNAAPEPVLASLPGMTRGGAAELVRLREAGYTARNPAELASLLGGRIADPADPEAMQRFARYAAYATTEVEIVSDGTVDGSPIRVRTAVLVTRTNAGALPLWRRIEE